ncbi:MAG: ADP-ribosylglycohydrolase family protein [Sporichthyaceae bacterium]
MADGATVDRAAGVLVAAAAADALVAGPLWPPAGAPLPATGEWTEITAFVLALTDAAVAGRDLRALAAEDRIAVEWWSLADRPLLWAGPLALAHLADPDALVAAAAALAAVAHLEEETGEAVTVWGLTVRHAVLTGELDVLLALPRLSAAARDRWEVLLRAAEVNAPEPFPRGEGAADTVAAAWATIVHTPVLSYDPEQHLEDALVAAARLGSGVLAVATAALLGAVHGASAVPVEWANRLHGAGGLLALDLIARARTLAAAAPAVDDEDLLRGL